MSQSTTDLANLFGAALNAVSSNRGQLNSMDEANHPNHGDNVTHNLGIIQSALQSQQSQNPSDALRLAAQMLSTQGRGSTAPQYAQGLQQAATHFQGQQNLSNNDMGLLIAQYAGSICRKPSFTAVGRNGGDAWYALWTAAAGWTRRK